LRRPRALVSGACRKATSHIFRTQFLKPTRFLVNFLVNRVKRALLPDGFRLASSRDPTISDRDPTISGHDPTISDRDPTISDRDPTISGHDPTIPGRDPTISAQTPALRATVAIRRFPITIRRFPIAIRRFPVMIRRFPVAIRRFPIAIRRFPVAIRRFPITIRRFPVAIRRNPTVAGPFLAPRWFAMPGAIAGTWGPRHTPCRRPGATRPEIVGLRSEIVGSRNLAWRQSAWTRSGVFGNLTNAMKNTVLFCCGFESAKLRQTRSDNFRLQKSREGRLREGRSAVADLLIERNLTPALIRVGSDQN
jgi:hypothetical protein